MCRAACLATLGGLVAGHGHEHSLLLGADPNPAGLGYEEVPLDLSYDHVPLKVEGKVPSFLNGTLYRGSPGAWPDGWWLDGLIMLNAFEFKDGQVYYSMQWNKDEAYNNTRSKTTGPEPLAEAPVPGGIPHPANSSWPTGVAFHQVAGEIVGSTGVSNLNSFDGDSLAPLEMPFEYSDSIGAPYLSPTHEQTLDGYVLSHLVTGMQKGSGGEPSYIITSIKPGSRSRDVVAKIEHPKESSPFKGLPSFQHMQLATSEFYIMLEAPCYYPSSATHVGNVDWAGWQSDLLASGHVRLVSRASGESTIYPLSYSVFAIHHINAYHDEATNEIVIDTIQTLPSFIPCSLAFKNLKMENYVKDWKSTGHGLSMSKIIRLRVPLDKPGAKIEPKQITTMTGMEFPTIRYDDYNGKPYRFAYGAWMSSGSVPTYDALVKLDVQTGEHVAWKVDGHYPGEPIFVADPSGKEEDDGVVMTNVLDTKSNQTYVLLLDAKSFKQIGSAGPTPHHIPHGFHGRYFDRKLNAPAAPELLIV